MAIAPTLSLLSALLCLAVVPAILRRFHRPSSDLPLILAVVLLAAERLVSGLSFWTDDPVALLRWQQVRFGALGLSMSACLVFSITYARGEAMADLRRWRWVVIGATLVPVALVLGVAGRLFEGVEPLRDESGWRVVVGLPGYLILIVAMVTAVLALSNLERTYRAAVGTMRWRIKFMLLAFGLILVVRFYSSSQAILFREVLANLDSIDSVATLLACPILFWSLLRESPHQTHVYPSSGVLLGTVTVFLAGCYLLVVGVLAKLVSFLGGDAAFALKAFVVLLSLVFLAAMLQSDRVRHWFRRRVSQHFGRPRFDYRSVWLQFIGQTSACVEEGELCRTVTHLTAEVMETLSVSIWLVNDSHDGFVLHATTSENHPAPGGDDPTAISAGLEVLRHFERAGKPVAFENEDSAWADTLRRWHPNVFPHGGDRLCVPMVRQEKLVGLLLLGDRVNGTAFNETDFEMLACVADHASASLLNLRLAHRLLRNRELVAFQTMAAFFVHDLKNSASTLSLMLKNLPKHFNDPEFRADALRGIGNTVDHINNLIERLSQIRHELKINAVACALDQLVTSCLADLSRAGGVVLNQDLRPLDPVSVDRNQLAKVFTNLALNAVEACQQGGTVTVSNGEEPGWQFIQVSDTGCGIAPDFLKNRLFQPFQTTKRRGLGIGMFQSRMIVEAHGGKITVSSTPGAGTTFRVYLPTHGS